MTIVKYALDEFVHDMEGLVAGKTDSQKIFDTGAAWLERLNRNPNDILDEFRIPAVNGGRPNHGTYLLYQGESGLSVTAVVWGPGEHLGPHDHRTWGMIGVLDNTLTETRYRRVDDRTREGYAHLEQDRQANFVRKAVRQRDAGHRVSGRRVNAVEGIVVGDNDFIVDGIEGDIKQRAMSRMQEVQRQRIRGAAGGVSREA